MCHRDRPAVSATRSSWLALASHCDLLWPGDGPRTSSSSARVLSRRTEATEPLNGWGSHLVSSYSWPLPSSVAPLPAVALFLGPSCGGCHTGPDRARPGQTRPDSTVPGRARPGQTRPDSTVQYQTGPDQARPGQAVPDRARPGQARPDQYTELVLELVPELVLLTSTRTSTIS